MKMLPETLMCSLPMQDHKGELFLTPTLSIEKKILAGIDVFLIVVDRLYI